MKVIRFENGNLTFYLQKRDVQILKSIKTFLPDDIFEDASFKNGECDENGYYKITNLDSIRALNTLSCIPEYSSLEAQSISQLTDLSIMADNLFMAIQRLVDWHFGDDKIPVDFDYYDSLFATENSLVDPRLVALLRNALEEEKEQACRLFKEVINQEIRMYNYSVKEMANTKRIEEERRLEAEREAKKLTFKKVISKLKRQ